MRALHNELTPPSLERRGWGVVDKSWMKDVYSSIQQPLPTSLFSHLKV